MGGQLAQSAEKINLTSPLNTLLYKYQQIYHDDLRKVSSNQSIATTTCTTQQCPRISHCRR